MRVLIVDDDEDLREVLGVALEAEGHQAIAAVDGLDALKQLLEGDRRPDVILLDMMLPRMDGEAFINNLRTYPELADIPVVLLSGHHAARQKAAQLRAAACLVKPIELDQLLAVIDSVVADSRSKPSQEGAPY